MSKAQVNVLAISNFADPFECVKEATDPLEVTFDQIEIPYIGPSIDLTPYAAEIADHDLLFLGITYKYLTPASIDLLIDFMESGKSLFVQTDPCLMDMDDFPMLIDNCNDLLASIDVAPVGITQYCLTTVTSDVLLTANCQTDTFSVWFHSGGVFTGAGTTDPDGIYSVIGLGTIHMFFNTGFGGRLGLGSEYYTCGTSTCYGGPDSGTLLWQFMHEEIIELSEHYGAGKDTSFTLCYEPELTLDLNDYIDEDADTSGVFSELTASGQFNSETGILNTDGLEGTYTFSYFVEGTPPCPDDSALISIEIFPGVIAGFEFLIGGFSSEDGITGGCIASPVQFNDLSIITDPGVITSWNWDFGDGSGSDEENPEHIYAAPGTYTITLTVETENGCTSTISFDIVMTERLTLDIVSNEPTCFGFSDGSITVNVIGGSGELIFEIRDALGSLMNLDNSNTANTLPAGWYYINVDDNTECSGLDSVFLDQPDEINADLTVVDPLCYGEASGWVRVDSVYNATGLYDQISFFWAPNPPNHEGLGADSLWDLTAGDYTLTINDDNGCSKVFDFVVDQPDSLHFVEFGFEHAYCRMFGYQSGNGVVFGAAAGGTPDYNYLWENLDNGESDISSTWGGLNPGTYRLTATDENGCIISREVFLDSLNPEAAFTVISDQLNDDCQGTAPVEVEFENNSINFYNHNDPFGDSTFFWNLNSPGGDWELTHDYLYRPDTTYLEKNQTYQVEVCLVALNKNGCSDTACKIITVYKPIAFEDINIFTPNGDGNNDVFTFEFRSASISEFHCVIVNRWGVVVEELNDIAEGWDGTDRNGDPCKDGVYFYKYEATTDSNNILVGQGNIQLVTGN